MSLKISLPELKSKGYERYKQELMAWKEVTELPKKKQGIAVALSLPEDHQTGIREKVFDEMKVEELNTDNGLDKIIEFMDIKLGKDDLTDSLEKFEEFENYQRESDQNMTDFISKFDQKYNRLVKLKMTLPQPILAFKLIRKANISRSEKLLVLTGLDYSKKDDLYEQAQKSLKKFKGEQGVGCINDFGASAMKLEPPEPAYVVDEEEALFLQGKTNFRSKQWSHYGQDFNRNRGQWRGRGVVRAVIPSRGKRQVNPSGPDGKPLLCSSCGSFRHLMANCPDSWENMQPRSRVNVVDNVENYEEVIEEEQIALFTGYNKDNLLQLQRDAQNCAVLDSACSSTVCGKAWMDHYLQSLTPEALGEVKRSEGKRIFRFGGGEQLKSEVCVVIPATLAGKSVTIATDVVNADLPLLLSKPAMKRARIKMDLENDSAEVLGVNVSLNCTASGHYCIPIDNGECVPVESVCIVDLNTATETQRYSALLKLHRQFAHPSKGKLIALLKDAGVWDDQMTTILDDIYLSCNLCKVYKKTPPRPVVAMPMAHSFNEKVAIDLKKWSNGWILHMVDMWSRLTISVFLSRKRPQDVIDKILQYWVGSFGIMKSILSDNGGEFSSDEMRHVSGILNVQLATTAADSPFQNGLCERNHGIVDYMLVKLKEEYPSCSLEVLLCWANMVKNTLQMWNGFSSYQLVFGHNPNLPDVMTATPPALDTQTSSEALAKHLNILHSAKKAFIETEASERIKRALRNRIRVSEEVYDCGDCVYYKRDGQAKWNGPAKVVFQDGNVVFVRHGGVFVRVSPNRLTRGDFTMSSSESKPLIPEDDMPQNPPIISRHESSAPASEEYPNDGSVPNIIEASDNSEYAAASEDTKTKTSLVKDDKITFRESDSDEWHTATIVRRAGKATGQYKDWYNIKLLDSGHQMSINLNDVQWKVCDNIESVNVVMIPQQRHDDADCFEAKQQELEKLKNFDTYETVEYCAQPLISVRWVISQKGSDVKARLVARGFEENFDSQSDSPTVGKCAFRFFLSITSSKGWVIRTTDIKSAFLQGMKLEREVFIKPPKEAGVSPHKVWKLKRCLYGLNDGARQFYLSVRKCLLDLGCQQSLLDPAVFYYKNGGELLGVICCHIDDFLHAGFDRFESDIIVKLTQHFLAGKVEQQHFTYIGFDINQEKSCISVNQKAYADELCHESDAIDVDRSSLKHLQLNSVDQFHLRRLVGKLGWLVQGSRPDMAFDMIDLSTKLKSGTVQDLLHAKKVVKALQRVPSSISFPQLHDPPESWKLVLFTDAAHANICENTGSVAAFVLFLVDASGVCCPIDWQACKIKRVVRSTLAAETLSLQEGTDAAFYVQSLLKESLVINVPIVAYVDNKSVCQALYSTKLVDDKRLRIDIAALQESLSHGNLEIRWCPGNLQLANCMTKRGADTSEILHTLCAGRIHTAD